MGHPIQKMKNRLPITSHFKQFLILLAFLPLSQANSIGADTTTILCLVNKARAENCLPELAYDGSLDRAAYSHSIDQANMGVMTHVGSDGSRVDRRIERQGWKHRWSSSGENVAVGYNDALQVMRAWLESPGHRQNLLGDFTHFGFGYDGRGKFWTQNFVKARDGTTRIYPDCSSVPQVRVSLVDEWKIHSRFTSSGYCDSSAISRPRYAANTATTNNRPVAVRQPQQPRVVVVTRPAGTRTTYANTNNPNVVRRVVTVQPNGQRTVVTRTTTAAAPAPQPAPQQRVVRIVRRPASS